MVAFTNYMYFFHLFHSPSLQMILVKVQSAGVIFKIMEVYMRYTLVNDELNCLPHWVMNCFGTMADGQSVYHAG